MEYKDINFDEIYRVKGIYGLVTKLSKPHKSGTIRVRSFSDTNNSFTVMERNLVSLGGLRFQTELGFDNLTVKDVFNNLFTYYNDKQVVFPRLKDFVPNYDAKMFTTKDSYKLFDWFNELSIKFS